MKSDSKFTHEVIQPLKVETGITEEQLKIVFLENEVERLRKYSMRYSQRVEQLYLLDSYIDGLVGEIEKGVDMDRLKELAKIYRHNKESGLYE